MYEHTVLLYVEAFIVRKAFNALSIRRFALRLFYNPFAQTKLKIQELRWGSNLLVTVVTSLCQTVHLHDDSVAEDQSVGSL